MRRICNYILSVCFRFIGTGIFILLPLRVYAEPSVLPENMETPRGLALGLGLRASAVGTSALSYNPAGMSVGHLYHIQALGSMNPKAGVYSAGGAIVDSATTAVAAGFSLRGLFNGDKVGSYSGLDGRLGFAISITDRLSLGLSGRYLTLKQKIDPALTMPPPEKLAKGVTGDISLRAMLADTVQLAFVGQNLINLHSPYAPVLAGGSLTFQPIPSLVLGGDVLVDFTSYSSVRPILGLAAEYFTGKVPFRLGYIYHNADSSHWLTGGLGYIDEKVSIDVSVRQKLNHGPDTLFIAGITYFVQ